MEEGDFELSKTTKPILRLERKYEVQAAHSLPATDESHKCHRTHGHNWIIELTVEGEVDTRFGWVVDFATIDQCFKPIFEMIDHQNLNTVSGLSNPTSENLCFWIADRIKPSLPANLDLVKVTVQENTRSKAIHKCKS